MSSMFRDQIREFQRNTIAEQVLGLPRDDVVGADA